MTSPSSFIPTIVVQPMGDNFWEEMSYLPGLSNVKAIHTFAFSIISTFAATLNGAVSAALLLKGYVFNDGWASMSGNFLLFRTLINIAEATQLFVIGVLESIPVVGNLSLAFLTGRIQINPNPTI